MGSTIPFFEQWQHRASVSVCISLAASSRSSSWTIVGVVTEGADATDPADQSIVPHQGVHRGCAAEKRPAMKPACKSCSCAEKCGVVNPTQGVAGVPCATVDPRVVQDHMVEATEPKAAPCGALSPCLSTAPPPTAGQVNVAGCRPQQRQDRRGRNCGGKKANKRHWKLSSVVLSVLGTLYVASVLLMVTMPKSQGLVTYMHWVKWPPFQDLTDLVSFRLSNARNIEVLTKDGVLLKGWHLLPTGKLNVEASRFSAGSKAREQFFDSALKRRESRVVLYFHGNGASRGHWNRVQLVKNLASMLDAHVIAVDYRGFADSSGWPSEEGLGVDAEAVWHWVVNRTDTSAHVYVYGQSLGAAVAMKLGHHLTGNPTSAVPRGLILDAPFTNLTVAAMHHPSVLPFRIVPPIRNILLASIREKFSSLELITQIPFPIIVLHGRRDMMIPYEIGLELYQTAKLARLRNMPDRLEDLWFSEFPQGGHNDLFAYPQWVNDLWVFMEAMEAAVPEQVGEGGEEDSWT